MSREWIGDYRKRPTNMGKGQTTQHDQAPPDKPKVIYTTERPDGLLVAHESRPTGFGPIVEAWTLELP